MLRDTCCQVRVWYRMINGYGITSSGSVCGLPVEGAAFDMCHTSVILFTSHFVLFIVPFLHLLTLPLFSPISPFLKCFPWLVIIPIFFSLPHSVHRSPPLTISAFQSLLPCDLDSSPPPNSHTLSSSSSLLFYRLEARCVFPDQPFPRRRRLRPRCCRVSAAWVARTHTHTHTHIQPVQHTHLSWTQHTHTHYSLQHTRIQKGQKGVVGGHQYTDVRFKQSVPGGVCNCVRNCVCVFVSAQCAFVYVFKCPGAWGWESGGVQKAFSFFFHRWIERTTFTNGLFSAQDSGFTSCLLCDREFCSYSPWTVRFTDCTLHPYVT